MLFFINNDFIINFLFAVYLILKLYRIIFFTKVIFEQLPLFNPNQWPLSIIHILLSPLTKFLQCYIPSINFGPIDLDISLLMVFTSFDIIINSVENLKDYFLVNN